MDGAPGVTSNVVPAVVPSKVPPQEPDYTAQYKSSFNDPVIVKVAVSPVQTGASLLISVGVDAAAQKIPSYSKAPISAAPFLP